METQKQSLKAMFEASETYNEKIMHLMNASYALQRKEINSETSMEELKRDCLYLFDVRGLLDHAKELLEIDIRNALGAAYRDKAVRVNRFFKHISTPKYEMIYDEARKQSEMDNIKAWLVLSHFGENEKDVFYVVDETTSVAEIEETTGMELLLLIVFAFYVFNLEYPPAVSATMEFIERCLIGINPDRGSKGNKEKKKKVKINPKVLRLINTLADFEWLESRLIV